MGLDQSEIGIDFSRVAEVAKNSHQKPVVVVLCENHLEAAGAVYAAHYLATLGVK